MANTSISFHPLDETHFSLIHRWFNQLHVQKFYSLRSWTLEEVEKKLTPYLRNEKGIQAFIIYFGKMPIGYIQSCPIKEHPWEDQALSDDIVQEIEPFHLVLGRGDDIGQYLETLSEFKIDEPKQKAPPPGSIR